MNSVIPEASTATPDPRDQRDSDAETAARIERWVDKTVDALRGETIYETVARETAERAAGRPGRPCTVYPWCEEVDTHWDHSGPESLIHSNDEEAEPLVWACVSHLEDSVPRVGLNGDDLSPDQAREKARELRQLANAVDNMADTVETARALANLRKVRETADPAFAEILTIMEAAIVEDGADPAEVGEQVLELLQQARAEKAGATA